MLKTKREIEPLARPHRYMQVESTDESLVISWSWYRSNKASMIWLGIIMPLGTVLAFTSPETIHIGSMLLFCFLPIGFSWIGICFINSTRIIIADDQLSAETTPIHFWGGRYREFQLNEIEDISIKHHHGAEDTDKYEVLVKMANHRKPKGLTHRFDNARDANFIEETIKDYLLNHPTLSYPDKEKNRRN